MALQICYLNAWLLHKHIDDVQRDLNFTNTDINFFSEARCLTSNNDITYDINGYSLFRNDSQSLTCTPFCGMAVFSRVEFLPGYPCCRNVNGIEITILRVIICHMFLPLLKYIDHPRFHCNLLETLSQLLISLSSYFNIFIGDFNINWFDEIFRRPLYNFFINDNNYRQLVFSFTTDNLDINRSHLYKLTRVRS